MIIGIEELEVIKKKAYKEGMKRVRKSDLKTDMHKVWIFLIVV